MVSTTSGQVAIAADHVLTQYCWYVRGQVGAIIGVRRFILRVLIPANCAYFRAAWAANGERDRVC